MKAKEERMNKRNKGRMDDECKKANRQGSWRGEEEIRK